MDGPPLASLSLTHVRYDPNDILSYISAYLALVPQALVIAYVSLIWGTREIEILLMFAGQMGCEALNWLLKRYIKEERPTRMWAYFALPIYIELLKALDKVGREANEYISFYRNARKRLRHALLPRPIRGLLLDLLDPLHPPAT